jgi:hypothetical protein
MRVERAELVARAVVFLIRMKDEDMPLDEAVNALSALAERFQSGAIVGGTLIDSSSATFDRVVYPSLPASPFACMQCGPFCKDRHAIVPGRTVIPPPNKEPVARAPLLGPLGLE